MNSQNLDCREENVDVAIYDDGGVMAGEGISYTPTELIGQVWVNPEAWNNEKPSDAPKWLTLAQYEAQGSLSPSKRRFRRGLHQDDEEEDYKIRIGAEYQVGDLPVPGKTELETFQGDCLWDPQRAQAAHEAGEDIGKGKVGQILFF